MRPNHTSTTCTLHSILFGSISCSDRKLGLPGHQKEQLRAPKLTPYDRGSNLTLTFNLPVSRCISTYLGAVGWSRSSLVAVSRPNHCDSAYIYSPRCFGSTQRPLGSQNFRLSLHKTDFLNYFELKVASTAYILFLSPFGLVLSSGDDLGLSRYQEEQICTPKSTTGGHGNTHI